VTSTIYDVVDGSRVLWGGTADGITGVHEWLFDAMPDGVHVTTNESFAGEPVAVDPEAMQSMLDGSLTSWLDRLKAAAESKA
jgi:acetylglutamate kinase